MSDKLVDLLHEYGDDILYAPHLYDVYKVAAEIREIVKEEIRKETTDPGALDAAADRREP